MNSLKQLIQQYCPDGVEYKKLGDVCNFQRGSSLVSKNAIEGDVPVILRRLIERLKQDFLKNGGIREQMYRARVQYQTNQSDQSNQSNQSDFKQPKSN